MRTIIITGTPGSGKTLLSVKLAKKLNFLYINVNKIIKKYKISEGYDKKRKTKVVDVKKLNKALIKEVSTIKKSIKLLGEDKKTTIITRTEGTFSPYLCIMNVNGVLVSGFTIDFGYFEIRHSSNITVSKNIFTTLNDPVHLRNSSYCTLEENIFKELHFSNNHEGFFLEINAHNNIIKENIIDGYWKGIRLNSGNNIVSNNHITS